ncbi:hypothetical protein ACIBBG_32065 [Micromonospora chersina]|uniref:DUF7341 domain-containing protein n=1 Tax=Micromonospora chersina TaxID=47854 RepID=UPI0037AF5E23
MADQTTNTRHLVVAEIAGYAQHLASSYWTQTPAYTKTRGGRIKLTGVHRTEQDGLLVQLAEVAAYGVTSPDDVHGARPVPQSRPPGTWEALALHGTISTDAARWTANLQLGHRDTVEAAIRQLAAAAGEPRVLDDVVAAALASAMRGWHVRAQALIGWITQPYRPRATCPVITCGRRDTLRVDVARKAAYCAGCQSIWDDRDGSIRVLAQHIEAQTNSRAVQAERVRSGHAGRGGAWPAEEGRTG